MTSDRLCAGSDVLSVEGCPTCGFSGAPVAPGEAVDDLRATPRSWRRALALDLDDADPGALLARRPGAGAWSALEHAGHVRDVIHALDIRIQRVLREDEPVLPGTHVTPPAGANEQGVAVVLAALSVSVDQLARTILVTPAVQWTRTGVRAGRTVTAFDLVQEAVHEAVHHRTLAEETIRELRLQATSAAG